jgi:hypothetical protein
MPRKTKNGIQRIIQGPGYGKTIAATPLKNKVLEKKENIGI